MSTIDDAARLKADNQFLYKRRGELVAEIARLQDQLAEQKEISVGLRCDNELLRIQLKQRQDQLATAREQLADADKVVRAVVDKDHIDIGWGKAVVMALEYERKYPALTAIPPSDRERLLEEAREICDAISGMEYNNLMSRTIRQVTELIPKARALRAKLPK